MDRTFAKESKVPKVGLPRDVDRWLQTVVVLTS